MDSRQLIKSKSDTAKPPTPVVVGHQQFLCRSKDDATLICGSVQGALTAVFYKILTAHVDCHAGAFLPVTDESRFQRTCDQVEKCLRIGA